MPHDIKLPAAERQLRLTEALDRHRFVSVTEAAALLSVSGMTVRRDLKVLEQLGVLQVTHGGAVRPRGQDDTIVDIEEPLFRKRQRLHAEEKRRIARGAAALVKPGQTVALDVGTSVLALAKELAARSDLHLFTNSLPIANALTRARSPVYVLGGQIRSPELAIVGSMALAQIKDFRFDIAFIGVSGITGAGFFDYALEDTQVKRAFIQRSKQVVVLSDASKFGHSALASIGSLDCCHDLITNSRPKGTLAKALARAGVRIHLT